MRWESLMRLNIPSMKISFEKYEITFEDALSKAYENRPDLQSIIAQRQAAERSIDLAKTGYYPVIAGNAGYSWSGEEFPLDHGWNAGATLSVPLFSGFLTKYQVEEARANLNVLKANEESLKQTIFLEVQAGIPDPQVGRRSDSHGKTRRRAGTGESGNSKRQVRGRCGEPYRSD